MINEESLVVQELIQKHEKVFQELRMKLPPKREIKHTIKVKSGSNPINIKPYQYPHHQKTEIERATYFSKLDLRLGYYQIRIRLEDIAKIVFRTHGGHYEFKVMPFGLTNAPTTFKATMNETFHPYLRKFVLVFFDDILIYSKTWKEHLQHLEQVLTVLEEHQFYAKKSKCTFGKEEVE
eukprot:PITA_24413